MREGSPEEFGFFDGRRIVERGGGLLPRFEGMAELNLFCGCRTCGIGQTPASDLAEPAGEFGGIAQAGEAFPSRDEGFLGDVFGTMEVAAGGVDEARDHRLIAADDLAEGLAVAGPGEGNELGVGGVGWDCVIGDQSHDQVCSL